MDPGALGRHGSGAEGGAINPTWRTLRARVEDEVGSVVDARRILERASGHTAAEMVIRGGDPVPARALSFVEAMVARRRGGEPLQYVLGQWGFRSLELIVDSRVLIPRPETETVVDAAIEELGRLGTGSPLAADLGTGSGAIAISLAVEVPRLRVWATDLSADALAVARANLAGAGSRVAPRVLMASGHWFEALPPDVAGHLDLVVSNPPYVAEGEGLPDEVAQWEPAQALVAGPTGLEAVAEIVGAAPLWLSRPGALVMEIAPHQAEEAAGLARRAGFAHVEVRADLADRPRTLVGRLAG